ncbi:hypothetical protein KSP40_PGU021520 [Platanthera guangdongensis]|uniref:Ribosomal protein S14 n=1 Tax=Platanthera guangdongensis TaxID=2320717 RepID=A0ABR2LU54_9ASPA
MLRRSCSMLRAWPLREVGDSEGPCLGCRRRVQWISSRGNRLHKKKLNVGESRKNIYTLPRLWY